MQSVAAFFLDRRDIFTKLLEKSSERVGLLSGSSSAHLDLTQYICPNCDSALFSATALFSSQ
jgi:hypothetical protein